MRRGVERREDPSPQCPNYWPRTTALHLGMVKEGGGVRILATRYYRWHLIRRCGIWTPSLTFSEVS